MEPWHGHAKALSRGSLEGVVPLHVPRRGTKNAEAPVSVTGARLQVRLFAYDPLAFHLGVVPPGIVDPPIAEKQPG